MAVEFLSEWRMEYFDKLTRKKEEYQNLIDLLEQKTEESDLLEQKINIDDDVFNPNDIFEKERTELDKLRDEKRQLEDAMKKDEQNISFLEERIKNLDHVLDEVAFLKVDHVTDKIKFVADIVESDPRRAKIELIELISQLKNVSRET